jgi:multiple sugar transport system substrate-binding protein
MAHCGPVQRMLVGVVLVATLAVGAGSGFGAPPVVLKMAYPGWDSKAQEEAVTSLLREFERQNPGIRVEVVSIPWPVMYQKLMVSLRSGDAPDLGYVIVRWLRELQALRFLADLTPQVNTLAKGDWNQATWDPATVGGRLYAIADRVDPYMIFYNRDLFERAGIRTFPDTMDEFLAAAKRLTGRGVYGFGLVGAKHATLIGQFMNFLYAFNGNFLAPDGTRATINDEAGVAAFEFYTDLLRKHGVAQPSAPADSRNEVRQLFMTGQVAMMIDGPWATGTFREMAPRLNWGVGKIPQVVGKERRSVLSAWYYVIFDKSPHKVEAWKLVSFMLRPNNMSKGVVTLPARRTAERSERFSAPEWAPWLDAAKYARPEPSTKYFNDIADITGDAIQEILLNRKTPRQAADDAAARITQLLRQ